MTHRFNQLLVVMFGLFLRSEVSFSAGAPASQPIGHRFLQAPSTSPAPLVGPVEFQTIRRHMERGQPRLALADAKRFVKERRWGRERDAAWLLIGLAHRDAGHHNLASEAFTKVRTTKGALAPYAAYYEAEQDLARGKPYVAIRECERYRSRYSKGVHRDACLRVIAKGWAQRGDAIKATRAAKEYDLLREVGQIHEQIELTLALWQISHQPAAAARRLIALLANHEAPLTGRIAEQQLALLREQGVAEAMLPLDADFQIARARSFRDSGRRDDAFFAYTQLAKQADDHPKIAAWAEADAAAFGWKTHHYAFLASIYQEQYAQKNNAKTLWALQRAQGRSGDWKAAAKTVELGLKKYPKARSWYHNEASHARTFMLAGDYKPAQQLLDARAARGGWTGRRARFFSAFSAFMDGDYAGAISRFNRIIHRNRAYLAASRYWRSQAQAALTPASATHNDDEWILANAPDSWYAVLVREGQSPEHLGHPLARQGRWPGLASAPPAPAPPPMTIRNSYHSAWPTTRRENGWNQGFSQISWPFLASTQVSPPPPEPPSLLLQDPSQEPTMLLPSALFSREETGRLLHRLEVKYGTQWAEFEVIADLASVGLYDLSGPLLAATQETWKRGVRSRYAARSASARSMKLKQADWRQLFLFARDYHHISRFFYGYSADLSDEKLKRAAERLTWPLAHAHLLWRQAQEGDIDPYLVLGVMRQESHYNAIAKSRVGARGAMQIMPKTGHLLADRMDDTHFTAGDLEDPIVSITYGIHYLSLLMERFNGNYPLAVASYNGGPHNAASWLAGTGSEMPMDQFVEHIPFKETRNYVKRVVSGYDRYLQLYTTSDTQLVLPPLPKHDRPEVVDF